jgi:putative component of toxin-antitoxin plasmid stabilization module
LRELGWRVRPSAEPADEHHGTQRVTRRGDVSTDGVEVATWGDGFREELNPSYGFYFDQISIIGGRPISRSRGGEIVLLLCEGDKASQARDLAQRLAGPCLTSIGM